MATAMDSYAPFDSGPGSGVTEDTWRAFDRRKVVSGVSRSVLNEMQVYADATGMQVKVPTGEILIEGAWGRVATEKVLPIAAAHATLARKDLVIARGQFVNNVVELDVITGTAASTPTTPLVTRNTSLYEIPLAVVNVPAASTSIASTQVLDARAFGGPVGVNASDDLSKFGDKYSSCNRVLVQTNSTLVAGTLFVMRTRASVEQTVSKLRVFLGDTAQVGGTFATRIFTGWRLDELTTFVDPGAISLTSGTYSVKEGTFTAANIPAGSEIAVGLLVLSATTAPRIGSTVDTSGTVGAAGGLLNPSSTYVSTVSKTVSSMPSTLNLLDGSWSNQIHYWWTALA